MFKKLKLGLVVSSLLFTSAGAKADWCDTIGGNSHSSTLLSSLLTKGCKAGFSGATGPIKSVAEKLVQSFLITLGLANNEPSFVNLSEESLEKIREIVNNEVTMILNSQEYAEVLSIVEALSAQTTYYGALDNPNNQIDFLIEELVPKALDAITHRAFQTDTPWAQANYALAVSYAMILNSLGLLINEGVDKGEINKQIAANMLTEYLNKLNAMEHTLKSQYRAKYQFLMHPTNCAYSYQHRDYCIISINNEEFRFSDTHNAMMDAINYKSELVQQDWLRFDPNAMVDTTQLFLNNMIRNFSQ
ncbi:hypothetical protein AADZ84_05895 [Colwelliaceae bacterium MEBiC 14330]